MKAVIFDFDGLILDTESSDYDSWQELYTAHGRELPFDLWLGNLGTLNRIDLCDHLTTLVERPLDTAALRQQRLHRHHEHVAGLPIMPGVESVIQQAKAMGLYLKALEKLGVAGHEAVALEDSLNGIRAAKAAGMFCIAVPGPLTRHLDYGAADCRLASLAELRLAEVSHHIGV
jgi:beta-phosphoglucomutase-like phosphatase (HAD superfamily)